MAPDGNRGGVGVRLPEWRGKLCLRCMRGSTRTPTGLVMSQCCRRTQRLTKPMSETIRGVRLEIEAKNLDHGCPGHVRRDGRPGLRGGDGQLLGGHRRQVRPGQDRRARDRAEGRRRRHLSHPRQAGHQAVQHAGHHLDRPGGQGHRSRGGTGQVRRQRELDVLAAAGHRYRRAYRGLPVRRTREHRAALGGPVQRCRGTGQRGRQGLREAARGAAAGHRGPGPERHPERGPGRIRRRHPRSRCHDRPRPVGPGRNRAARAERHHGTARRGHTVRPGVTEPFRHGHGGAHPRRA